MAKESIQEIYQKSGFTGRVGFGKSPAVVVVDYISGFTDPSAVLGQDYTTQIEATHQLLITARAKGLPLFFVALGFLPNAKDAAKWLRRDAAYAQFVADSPATQVDERLGYDDSKDAYIVKQGDSAFFGTNLGSQLVPLRVDTLILAGCRTSTALRATAVDACQNGYRTIVPRECTADSDPAVCEANLFDINAKYADVMSLEDVVNLLSIGF